MTERRLRVAPDDDLLRRISAALDSADVDAFSALLAPHVTWGAPDDPIASCQNRGQVLVWYQRGFDAGVRAKVVEVTALGANVLVGLMVTGDPAAEEAGGQIERWQVLAIDQGLVTDIRGFDDRATAVVHAGSWIRSDRW